jgi:hypothetical protein
MRSLTFSNRRRALQANIRLVLRYKSTGHVLEASEAMRSKMSLTKELRIAMALLLIPVSGWTCLRT